MELENQDEIYIPNEIPREKRIAYISISLGLLAYGIFGVVTGNVGMPLKRSVLGERRALWIHGFPTWIMFAAIIVAILNLMLCVVDHYDKRNNEHRYRKWADVTMYSGLALFFASLIYEGIMIEFYP